MAVLNKDIILLAADVAPEDDVTTSVGGAVENAASWAGGKSKIEWEDLAATEQVKIVSENAADTMNVTIHYRTAGGAITSEVKALNGTTPATTTASMERLMKAILASAPAGNVALYGSTVTHGNTADAGGSDYIDLDAATAGAAEDLYNFHVIYITSGTGSGQVREIVKYGGSGDNYRAYVRDWGTNPDATSVYEIHAGMVFEQNLAIAECRRQFYDAAADAPGGSERTFIEKIHVKNVNVSKDLTNAKVAEDSGGAAASIAFDVESSLNGSDNTSTDNRLNWAGGSYTFDSAQKDLGAAGDGDLTFGDAQGIWCELTLAAGAAAAKSFYPMVFTGQST